MRVYEAYRSINPATGEPVEEAELWHFPQLERALQRALSAGAFWRGWPLAKRTAMLQKQSRLLQSRRDELARIITLETGKLIGEAREEIEQCVQICDYYAENAAALLADEPVKTGAAKSYVCYQPLGTVLAIMPWNFPFWQIYRCTIPALVAGNTVLLKHASNTPRCAREIERLMLDAGCPEGVFTNLLISTQQIDALIADDRVSAVSFAGNRRAGSIIATAAGKYIKKSVLELGGSDPFILLQDADLDQAVRKAVSSGFHSSGQSSIAAKRFIVLDAMAEAFISRFAQALKQLRAGDPMDPDTSLAPLAKASVLERLEQQVQDAIDRGALLISGGEREPRVGYFYKPTLLDRVTPAMRVYHEELFGPLAVIIRAADESHAIQIANASNFGMGASVWTADTAYGERICRQLRCGCTFVNAMVKSDPRLPFGGIKASGYGRDVAGHGLREFTNAKAVWVE